MSSLSSIPVPPGVRVAHDVTIVPPNPTISAIFRPESNVSPHWAAIYHGNAAGSLATAERMVASARSKEGLDAYLTSIVAAFAEKGITHCEPKLEELVACCPGTKEHPGIDYARVTQAFDEFLREGLSRQEQSLFTTVLETLNPPFSQLVTEWLHNALGRGTPEGKLHNSLYLFVHEDEPMVERVDSLVEGTLGALRTKAAEPGATLKEACHILEDREYMTRLVIPMTFRFPVRKTDLSLFETLHVLAPPMDEIPVLVATPDVPRKPAWLGIGERMTLTAILEDDLPKFVEQEPVQPLEPMESDVDLV